MTTRAPSQPTLWPETELPSMSSSQAGLARTSLQRARDLAWTEHAADYGAKSPVWLAHFDPSCSSWKTAQLSLEYPGGVTLAAFSGTWPRSGTMRNGIASALPDLMHPTSAIASGLWRTGEELLLTLMATDATRGGRVSPRKSREGGALIEHISMEVFGPKELLPTLTASRRSGLQSHGENAILGALNPTWCEWYMGLPIGWTASMD